MRKKGKNKLGRKMARAKKNRTGFVQDSNGNVQITGTMGRRNYERQYGAVGGQPEEATKTSDYAASQLFGWASHMRELGENEIADKLEKEAGGFRNRQAHGPI